MDNAFWASFRVIPLCHQFPRFTQMAISRSQLKVTTGISCLHLPTARLAPLSQHSMSPADDLGREVGAKRFTGQKQVNKVCVISK